jgi:HPt (histidine-containing phosphotransfer) domain-containing protein
MALSSARTTHYQYLDVARGVGMMGSEASLRKILTTVVASLSSDLPKMDAALNATDTATANRLLHGIKGYAPIFATDALVEQVTHVELVSKTEPATTVAALYADLSPVLQGLLAEIRGFLSPG